MTWLRMVIRSLLGHTRYHDQMGEVTTRRLRAELLERRLQVIQRRHQ